MAGVQKALITLQDETLLARVIRRLQPQTGTLLLSTGGQDSGFDVFGLPVVPDILPPYRGPLTGLCSALQYLAEKQHDDGLVVCPCDAPFVPLDLAERLVAAGRGKAKPVVAVSYEGELQPTFSLWHSHHLPLIQKAVVEHGHGGLKRMFYSLPREVIEWMPSEPPPFYNVNTPAELNAAAKWLEQAGS
jgi:molybdopterin-guanine dinucleotide biosynthesis protein A